MQFYSIPIDIVKEFGHTVRENKIKNFHDSVTELFDNVTENIPEYCKIA